MLVNAEDNVIDCQVVAIRGGSKKKQKQQENNRKPDPEREKLLAQANNDAEKRRQQIENKLVQEEINAKKKKKRKSTTTVDDSESVQSKVPKDQGEDFNYDGVDFQKMFARGGPGAASQDFRPSTGAARS